MKVILCMWTNTVWQLGRYILTVLKQNFVSNPSYLPGSKLSHMWDFSSCLLFSQLNNELKAKLCLVSSLCGFHFLAFQVLGGFMITSQGTSIMHLKKRSCWNLISCMYRNYLSLLLLLIWKLCLMVFGVLQAVKYLRKMYWAYSPMFARCFSHLKVQGMSFIAAVLILNLEEADAFIAFANLLNKPCQLAFFRVDHSMVCT